MEIRFLAECTDTIPQLAEWFTAEWPGEVFDDIESRFHTCTNTNEVPIGLVAVVKGRPIGTIQLLSTSVHSHPHLKPWIGGLYVAPEWRHQKVATRLIEAALEVAKSIKVEKVYIGIQSAREFYEESGWRYEEDGEAHLDKVMILSRQT